MNNCNMFPFWFLSYPLCGLLHPTWIFPSYSRILYDEAFIVFLDNILNIHISLFLLFFIGCLGIYVGMTLHLVDFCLHFCI